MQRRGVQIDVLALLGRALSTTFTLELTLRLGVSTAPAPALAPSALNVLGITANTLTGVVSFSRATVAPPKA